MLQTHGTPPRKGLQDADTRMIAPPVIIILPALKTPAIVTHFPAGRF